MQSRNPNAIGGQWLCQEYELDLVNEMAVSSQIGGRRHTVSSTRGALETYQEVMRPDATVRGHLTFHLKHEVVSIELLSRLFAKVDPSQVQAWVADEPTSQYARRAGFLYEWLTGKSLQIDTAKLGGSYCDALDGSSMVVASAGEPNRRWRIRDNMPGTREFCPTVRLTQDTKDGMAVDCRKLIEELQIEFGTDMLLKSAVWLTLRESRSSFAIEGEDDKKDRIARFAEVLDRYTGTGEPPLDQASLAMLQEAILGQSTSIQQPGIRKSPVFVGQTVRYQEVIHYVAPPHADVEFMLLGVARFLQRTGNQSSVMRSAVASFGFVYIHPLADGNGRVHRFLINDILRRDGAVPAPLILPVSGLITRDHRERKAYDDALDAFSKPLMKKYAGASTLDGPPVIFEDGIASNFSFDSADDARHAWRYMDFTSHVQFLGDALVKTIREEIRDEAMLLQKHLLARNAVKEVIEMPDAQVDRVIRSVEQNKGVLSGVLSKEIPALLKPGVWADITEAVRIAFGNGESSDESLTSSPPSA